MYKFEFVLFLVIVSIYSTLADRFPVHIIHINDFHARFEATDSSAGTCNGDGCIGGYARTVYTVKRLLKENSNFNPLYLNAGDNFQGTLWYNIGRWNVTSQFLNMLPADAMTLGNHEFDNGVAGCVPFLETLKSPMLVANMDASKEPTMQEKFNKSMIIERSGRKIGIIGLLLQNVYDLANVENLIFTDEVEALREEAKKLKAQGANIIIALTHCGYDLDQEIAKNAGADVDVIVGAHSHTFLYTGTPPENFPFKKGFGDYPTVVTNEDGHRILIVQASAYARFVGNIRVYFDDDGEVLNWEGAPLYMSADVPEDTEVMQEIKRWNFTVKKQGSKIVGTSKVALPSELCKSSECNLGNLVCDAMVHEFLQLAPYNLSAWTNVSIAFLSASDMYSSINKGTILYEQIYNIFPYETTLTALKLTGLELKNFLETSIKDINLLKNITDTGTFLQFSGLKVSYNLKAPINQRVANIKIRCAACEIPEYEILDLKKSYQVITTRYLANINKLLQAKNKPIFYSTDFQAILRTINVLQPIITPIEGRVTFI